MSLTLNDYQRAALETLNQSIPKDSLLLNALMGLCGESGEAIDLLKKHLFQGHELDREKMVKELGDVAWYLAEAAQALDVSLEDICQRNIDKLRARYPKGFSAEKSIRRENE